jgi:hypothetical protein
VNELRARRLPLADVATKVRLTKTPAQYRASKQREGQYEALLSAGRTHWEPGERVRFYRAVGGQFALLEESQAPRTEHRTGDASAETTTERSSSLPSPVLGSPVLGSSSPAYDAEHYVRLLVENYAGRLHKAFAPDDFAQMFRLDTQIGLFDRDIAQIEPRWILPAVE